MRAFVTSDTSLERDLRASWAARKPIETIGDFLNVLMARGLTLDVPLASIEFGISQYGDRRIVIDETPEGVEIRESTR